MAISDVDVRQSDPSCVFCRIAAGEIPAHMLYEDEQVMAFLDVGPLASGHTLVVPRVHAVTLDAVPAEVVGAVAQVAARLAPAILASVNCHDWNLLQNNGAAAGQVVPHVHFHIIPRSEGDALGFRWPAGKLDPAEAKALAGRIAARL